MHNIKTIVHTPKPLRKCVDNLCITAMIVLIPLNIRAIHVKDKIMCRLGW